jgi:hypothetical protein
VPNEKFNVAQIISGQTARWTAVELKEFGSFSHVRIGPFHLVRYSGWRAGGVYLVFPLWIMVVFFLVLVGIYSAFFVRLNGR